MLAAGDIPDLVIGANAITDSDMVTFNGLFEDLSDDMDSLPNVAAMFEAVPEAELMATRPEGQIYSIPSYRRFWPQTSTRQYLNQQWLDNLGLEQPTTWQELHEVLLAFKRRTPTATATRTMRSRSTGRPPETAASDISLRRCSSAVSDCRSATAADLDTSWKTGRWGTSSSTTATANWCRSCTTCTPTVWSARRS
ncbi:hypothetical protein GCM10029992_51520 [Glycomyces albus]